MDLQKLQNVPISLGEVDNEKEPESESRSKTSEDRFDIKYVSLQSRWSDSETSRRHHDTNNHIWFDGLKRGGSEILFSDFKDLDFSKQKLNKVDLSYLKLNYGDISTYPQLNERISLPRIQDLKMSKSHNIVLTCEPAGNIFVSGIGTRGKLGLGHTQPQASYVGIPFFKNQKIIDADLSNDHSIVLNSNNQVFTWGSNSNGQLGYQTEIQFDQLEAMSLLPKQLITGDLKKMSSLNRFLGVRCSKFHSLAFTKDEIYLWGLNIGQFGFDSLSNSSIASNSNNAVNRTSGFVQATPRKLVFSYGTIKQVYALDYATIVLTTNDDIHIYHNGFHTRVQPPLYKSKISDKTFDTFRPRILSKRKSLIKLITQKNCNNILMLYDNGDIVEFTIDTNTRNSNELLQAIKFTTIWCPSKEHLRCTNVDLSNDGSIIICVRDGSVYKRIKRNTIKNFNISKRYKFTKINHLNKVVKVITDPVFSKFSFIRDDVDLIPHKLPKSNLFNDIARLSPLFESDDSSPNLKQKTSPDRSPEDSYITNLVYKTSLIKNSEEIGGDLFEEDKEDDLVNGDLSDDLLYKMYSTRWSSANPLKSVKMYSSLKDTSNVKDLLKSDDLYYDITLKSPYASNKFFDMSILVKDETKENELPQVYELPVHREFLITRSETLYRLINEQRYENNELSKDGIFLAYDKSKSKLTISGKITLRAVLIVVNLIYTDNFVDIWSAFPLGKAPVDISRSRKPFDSLIRILKMITPIGKIQCQDSLIDDLSSIMTTSNDDIEYEEEDDDSSESQNEDESDSDENDTDEKHMATKTNGITKIILKDGELRTYFPILVARSSYFETMFSHRWSIPDEISFALIETKIFQVVLKYLYGERFTSLFDEIDSFNSIGSFINFVLDAIQVADELLLTELSDIFQLYLKDFISMDNVIVLLQHAFYNKADKLFENCLWFICNNIDYFLFDVEFNELITEMTSNYNNNIEFLKRIDRALKWFKSLKSKKPVALSDSVELVKDSDIFIKQFILDASLFDSEFLHPILLEEWGPFHVSSQIDPLPTGTISVSERRRRSSNRKIEDINASIPGASRRISSITQSLLSLRENSADYTDQEFAIDDKDYDNSPVASSSAEPVLVSSSITNENKDEFIVVTGKRNKRVSSSSGRQSFSEAISIQGGRVSSISRDKDASAIPSDSSEVGFSPSSSLKEGSPKPWSFATSASSVSNSVVTSTPVAGSSSVASVGIGSSNSKTEFMTLSESIEHSNSVSSSSNSLIKAPSNTAKIRVSQKDRRRQMKESAPAAGTPTTLMRTSLSPWNNVSSPTQAAEVKYKNPWGGATSDNSASADSPSSSNVSSSSSSMVNIQASTSSSATFASKLSQKSKVNFAPLGAMSLEDIQLQELLQQEENKKAAVRTLDEIRQEEEFARWWAEESAKVQKQLKGPTSNNKNNKNNNRRNKNNSSDSTNASKRGNNSNPNINSNSLNINFNSGTSGTSKNKKSPPRSNTTPKSNSTDDVAPTFTVNARRKSSVKDGKKKVNLII